MIFNDNAFVLPQMIEHDLYESFLSFARERQNDEITLHCRGDGGDTDTALAMNEIIRAHGNVTGILVGTSHSSSSTIFASCQQRYITEQSIFSVHGVTYNLEHSCNQQTLDELAEEGGWVNARIATIYAEASTWGFNQWLQLLKRHSGASYYRMPSHEMVSTELAKLM